jgi:hypothetical protein
MLAVREYVLRNHKRLGLRPSPRIVRGNFCDIDASRQRVYAYVVVEAKRVSDIL